MESCLTVLLCLIMNFLFNSKHVEARKHNLYVRDDDRQQINLLTFGFVRCGYMDISVTNFHPQNYGDGKFNEKRFGFTLDKSVTTGASPLLDDQSKECHLNKSAWTSGSNSVVYLLLDLNNSLLRIDKSDKNMKHLTVKYQLQEFNETADGCPSNVTNDVFAENLPVSSSGQSLSFHFSVWILRLQEEGLYNLIFHNCDGLKVNFSINMVEKNPGSFLSVGQQPLPVLYFVFCILYVIVGYFWLWILCNSNEGVFKIHYLMLALMFIKAIAMLFHGVNYHFISIEGHQEEAFAVLYYIMYLVKGIFMFVTIVLIGAGWTFVKHVLSVRDKKIFVIVIPFQILANVATIIIEESDEGMSYYLMLKNIFIIIDLVCCGAILFPVIWSIRHLQQASQTDGKAAINLKKLKIFRHFYILVVCYIYFTRIIVLLVRIAVQFQFEWLDELFVELATLAFFVLTGYKFRPASNNPYLQLSQDDDNEEDEILTRSGALEMITKLKSKATNATGELHSVTQRENSHVYD